MDKVFGKYELGTSNVVQQSFVGTDTTDITAWLAQIRSQVEQQVEKEFTQPRHSSVSFSVRLITSKKSYLQFTDDLIPASSLESREQALRTKLDQYLGKSSSPTVTSSVNISDSQKLRSSISKPKTGTSSLYH